MVIKVNNKRYLVNVDKAINFTHFIKPSTINNQSIAVMIKFLTEQTEPLPEAGDAGPDNSDNTVIIVNGDKMTMFIIQWKNDCH